jgi:hypothetical protein
VKWISVKAILLVLFTAVGDRMQFDGIGSVSIPFNSKSCLVMPFHLDRMDRTVLYLHSIIKISKQ